MGLESYVHSQRKCARFLMRNTRQANNKLPKSGEIYVGGAIGIVQQDS